MNFNCQLRFEPKQDVSVHVKQTCFDFPKRVHVGGKKSLVRLRQHYL